MILVTVGTHKQPFDRLVRAADELAALLVEEVVVQYGHATYTPRHANAFSFTDSADMTRLVTRSRVVVTHAAAGAILLGMKLHRPLIVVPRRAKHGEHMDDHQLQLAQALAAKGEVRLLAEPTAVDLHSAIHTYVGVRPAAAGGAGLALAVAVANQLAQWSKQPQTQLQGAGD